MIRTRRARVRLAAGLGAGVALSLVSTTAFAAITSSEDAPVLASALVGAATVSSAALSVDYACLADDPATTGFDETKCNTAISNTPLTGFPTHGDSYLVLSTGNAARADDPNTGTGDGDNWGKTHPEISSSVHDMQVLRVDLGPASGNCLAFDFRFMSEEYPEFLNKGYNDAFLAQLNSWAVAVDPTTQAISAPGDFAAGAGDVLSVDSSGPTAMAPEHAAGTTYDGGTLPLVARKPVVPGSANTVFFTVFDQGDGIYDTTVFLDNLRYEQIDPAKCKSLALDPAEGTTGVTPTTPKPLLASDLSTLVTPLACNLPPGPINCDIIASTQFASWGTTVPWRKAAARGADARGITPFATGAATIAPSTTANLTQAVTAEGKAAYTAAKKKPKKLKKKAKKLLKKAKTAPPLKAKKLTKKAKKLLRKAKKLANKPIGTIAITLTNPKNQKSETLVYTLDR